MRKELRNEERAERQRQIRERKGIIKSPDNIKEGISNLGLTSIFTILNRK